MPCPLCGEAAAVNLFAAPDRFHGRKERYNLIRCPKCTLVRLAPPPTELTAHYSQHYDAFIGRAAATSPGRYSFRRDVVTRYKQGGALLDVGCGTGDFLSAMNDGNWRLHGIEMSEASAALAGRNSSASVKSGLIEQIDYAPACFDVITCFDLIEHLGQPRGVVERLGHWLKPGGLLYVQVPNFCSAAARVFGGYWYGLEIPRHLSHFSPASLRYLMQSANLAEVFLVTRRQPFVEYSTRYVLDGVLEQLGLPAAPLSQTHSAAGIAWKIIRKALRLTVLRLANGFVSLAGEGESIHALFRKPAGSGPETTI